MGDKKLRIKTFFKRNNPKNQTISNNNNYNCHGMHRRGPRLFQKNT